MKKIKAMHITVGGLAVVLSIIFGAYSYAEKLGFDIDRPAWQSEIIILAQAIESIQKTTDQRELFRLRQIEDDLVLKIATDEAKGKPPDPLDVLKLQQIRRQIDDLKQAQ